MYKLFFVSVIFLLSCQQKSKSSAKLPNSTTDTVVAEDTILNADTLKSTTKVSEKVSSAQTIIAGEKIGRIIIGEKGSAVIAQLGPADYGDAAMQKSISAWYSKKDSSIQTKVYFENDMTEANTGPRVVQIRVNSPYFKTAEGITTGSKLDEILKYYPNIKSSLKFQTQKGSEKISVMDDSKIGIAFEINANKICKGITVHKPGHELFGYLQFYK